MENRKDIGKAINEKLNSLDKMPREQVWIGINEELQKKKKRRFAFYFLWMKVAGLLLIGAIAASYFYENDRIDFVSPKKLDKSIIVNESNDGIIGTGKNAATVNSGIEKPAGNTNKPSAYGGVADDHKENPAEKTDRVVNRERISRDKNLVNRDNNSNRTIGKRNSNNSSSKSIKTKSKLHSKVNKKAFAQKSKSGKSTKEKDNLAFIESNSGKKDSIIVDLTSLQGKKSDGLISENTPKKTDSLAKKEKDKTKTIFMYPKEKKDSLPVISYKKIDLDVYVSPTYYGFVSTGSTLDSRLDSLPKKSKMKLSYGIGLTYDLSDRLSFRIGYSKVNLSYVTKNASIDASNYNGIDYKPNISNETILTAAHEIDIAIGAQDIMDITQKISYTEIPVEVKYKFLDKKIGLKAAIGFSYLLLDENEISIKTDSGFTQDIGKTKDLSKIAFSANLGAEADYPLFKNTKIFIEPTFNYQINASSNSNFKPYYIGIHTGIRYSFNN